MIHYYKITVLAHTFATPKTFAKSHRIVKQTNQQHLDFLSIHRKFKICAIEIDNQNNLYYPRGVLGLH